VDDDKTLRQAMSLFLRSGFSRIPVVAGGPDDVRGVLYLKDVTRRVHADPSAEKSVVVTEVMRPAHFVPESKPVDDLLREMQQTQNHVAVAVDEYGGTAGLVTIEDILEEIVGEITDEYDREEPGVEQLEDGVVRVRSAMHVDELGELFDRELDDDEVDTVGGLLSKALGRVPIPGATAVVDGLELVAERPAGRRHRIATVLVRAVDQNEEVGSGAAADTTDGEHGAVVRPNGTSDGAA
jgi:CBS domain containing-hemolysin-like protein